MAELIGIADQCLNAFPGMELAEHVIYITHTDGQCHSDILYTSSYQRY